MKAADSPLRDNTSISTGIVGKTFGRLTVLERGETVKGVRMFLCRCSCGTLMVSSKQRLVSGNTKSCGCLKREKISALNKSHGLSYTRFYWVFHGMKARCYNKNHNRYDLYGGKGIEIEWKSFDDFVKDMHEPYLAHCKEYGQRNTLIERRDSDKNYCKENCYWATTTEQANNTNRNFRLTFNGENKTLAQWCRQLNLSYCGIKSRLYSGWSVEDAFTIPVVKYQKIMKRK